MRLVRCDRCKQEDELISQLGSGFPSGWVETPEGDFCKKCYRQYQRTMNDFKNPPTSTTGKVQK